MAEENWMLMDGALRVTFLGAGLLCAAGGIHVYEHGYHEFWRFPISQTSARVLNIGGLVMFSGATATLIAAAMDID
jgi:hypothetical protein